MQAEIYLDNAATTRVLPEVVACMQEAMLTNYGNPSSPHAKGVAAEAAVRRAREQVAATLGVDPDEIVFTSGGTEANNLAIKGAAWVHKRRGGRLVCSAIEHPSVLEAITDLGAEGFDTVRAPVTREGVIDLDALADLIDANTRLLSIMAVNNEVGSVQPLKAACALARRQNPSIVIHVDAVQAYGKVPVKPRTFGADLVSLSAHKIHGPKGIGALYVRRGLRLLPLVSGGRHEGGLRSGTENVPGIVALGEVASKVAECLAEASPRMARLRSLMTKRLTERIPDLTVNTPEDAAPHILNVSIPRVKGEVLVRALGAEGVHISTGSACSTRKNARSHVLAAMGLPKEAIDGSLRISFSQETTEAEIEAAADRIARMAADLQAMW